MSAVLKPSGVLDQGRRIEDFLRSNVGSEVVLEGQFACGLHTHPRKRAKKVCFTIPSGTHLVIPAASRVFFAEYADEPRIRDPQGRPSSVYCDLWCSLEDAAADITIELDGELDGRGSRKHTDQWFHGLRLWGARDCHVIGSGAIVDASNGVHGGGGPGETFALDFPGGRRGPCSVVGRGAADRRLELRSGRSTGFSQNGGMGTPQGWLLLERIYSHHFGAHGGTSWQADHLVTEHVEVAHNGGTGIRREHGDGHVDEGLFAHDNARGVNLLDCTYEADLTAARNREAQVQLNAVRGIELRGYVAGPRPVQVVDNKGRSTGIVDRLVR